MSKARAGTEAEKSNPVESPIIKSERLYLREVRVTDVNERYYSWMNDPDISAYLESRFSVHSMESLVQYVKKVDADPGSLFFAICKLDDSEHIGNIKLGPINWQHRRAAIGIIIGEKKCWGKGFGSEAIKMMTTYAFEKLSLSKLTAGCYAANEGSARAFEKSGWIREGYLHGNVIFEGKPHDCILLGMTSSKYWEKKQ
ncbi:GNAT family N-acetyltransferase [Desulfolutivibrio sulfoxidireducens]|uniref:GNAT family N-acetyltransferase n=1 Tax=Desulfolutivibrio sulfoxidireducens TaxID=2773299 RepID=UPI00159E31A2|nr:GNAT family protein [Desulfolutivibrio sulfoxidireducens]QLA14910.1 GNAT family N-acetyltransferase [Desulfolutivibrio sulfoxidireducens]QLA18476.1 GNAT family N-acetyltransferase [Desulfolutivibrio sulfoxidireducens]